VLPGSFAVEFDEAFPARVAMVRTFYSGDYVKNIEQVVPARVGQAILARLFG
jgi:hypothetical protein